MAVQGQPGYGGAPSGMASAVRASFGALNSACGTAGRGKVGRVTAWQCVATSGGAWLGVGLDRSGGIRWGQVWTANVW